MDLQKLQLIVWKLYSAQAEGLLARRSVREIFAAEELTVTVLAQVSF